MNIEEQDTFLTIINDSFKGMKNMLNHIQEKITEYPVYTQLEFIKPIQHMIVEALQDVIDDNNVFLNNYDGGDAIKI